MLHGETQGATGQPEAAFLVLEYAGAATSPAVSPQLLLSPGDLGWALRGGSESGAAQAPLLVLIVLGTPL